jgi:hypothetical protein
MLIHRLRRVGDIDGIMDYQYQPYGHATQVYLYRGVIGMDHHVITSWPNVWLPITIQLQHNKNAEKI